MPAAPDLRVQLVHPRRTASLVLLMPAVPRVGELIDDPYVDWQYVVVRVTWTPTGENDAIVRVITRSGGDKR